jgi:hypothetical protein
MKHLFAALPLLLLAAATPARADEVFAGIYAHDIDSPLNLRGLGQGSDFHLGWRGDRIRGLGAIGAPSPYAFVAVNTGSSEHYAAVGIGWKIGRQVYLRPGIGLAVHTAPTNPNRPVPREAFGSRILFEPELALGVQVSERVSVEASLVHMSHATLLDNVGVRVNYRF